MGSWKSHVRAKLQQRDQTEKVPYVGVFTSLSQLEERFEIRKQILDDVQSKSIERSGVDVGKNTRLLQLQLRESEHLAEKLSQTVSDLTTVLYLKEAELQYWQSRVSHCRQEALTLAKGRNTLKATISELGAWTEKEELLQRWMEEKREEAVRLNKYNAAQERWQHWAKQLKRHRHRDMAKEDIPIVTSSWSGTTQTSPSVIQRINNTAVIQQGHSDHNHDSAAAKV
ncbi:hypothetical protein D5F01_LYC21306 [Larimichthys crocea]|uniref:Uncharacterized protein n=1 Tax=Larimichthys crocea TaxID=215358 RepID=A0A6G0HNU7_LARCR|nr:hypothetical protein D5F01_LYC21306 [Larimichthys crocea]